MSLVFVVVERCVFFLLFCQFLIQNFLKTVEIVIRSLIQRIFMQIGVETCAKNAKSHQKTISLLYKLFNLRSGFSCQNYDEHICVHFFHCSVLIIANNIFQQQLVFLSSLCVDKDLTINIL